MYKLDKEIKNYIQDVYKNFLNIRNQLNINPLYEAVIDKFLIDDDTKGKIFMKLLNIDCAILHNQNVDETIKSL